MSVIDYGLGLTTLSQTNLQKLDRIQNEAMRVILGTTKDTPIEAMRFILDLPPMKTRQSVEQVKAYLKAAENRNNSLHDAVKEPKGDRLKRGKSWMGQAEDTISQVCQLSELRDTKEWENQPRQLQHFYQVVETDHLGQHCRDWASGRTDAEIRTIIEENTKPHDLIIYTDGSVSREKKKSGWGFTAKQNGKTIHEDSAAHEHVTSSLTMEVEAVTHALQWLETHTCQTATYAMILTDSMNLIEKIKAGWGSPDWHKAIANLDIQKLLWVYCPGHAGVKGNERADRLAGNATTTTGLHLGRSEVLRAVRQHLQQLEDNKEHHHSVDRLLERDVQKGSGRSSTLRGPERALINQTNIGTVSKVTLGRLLKGGEERLSSVRNDPILNSINQSINL